MKLLFGWHISFEHHFYKSVRNEYSVRLWRKVKYVKVPKVKTGEFIQTELDGGIARGFVTTTADSGIGEVPGDAGYQVNP